MQNDKILEKAFKGIVSQQIGFYVELCQIKSVLSIILLRVLICLYFIFREKINKILVELLLTGEIF
jgi:hypothetical protein